MQGRAEPLSEGFPWLIARMLGRPTMNTENRNTESLSCSLGLPTHSIVKQGVRDAMVDVPGCSSWPSVPPFFSLDRLVTMAGRSSVVFMRHTEGVLPPIASHSISS
jgi:hypothetical protein